MVKIPTRIVVTGNSVEFRFEMESIKHQDGVKRADEL